MKLSKNQKVLLQIDLTKIINLHKFLEKKENLIIMIMMQVMVLLNWSYKLQDLKLLMFNLSLKNKKNKLQNL